MSLSKEQILGRIEDLVQSFDPDDCINFAYSAVEELEEILAEDAE